MEIQRFQVSCFLSCNSYFTVEKVVVVRSLTLRVVAGIGLPGVAASGTIAANTLASVKSQKELMKELQRKGALQ